VHSPHREADDIWARFGLLSDPPLRTNHRPFRSHWYYSELTAVLEPVVSRLIGEVGGLELGGVLITRIPPGGQVYAHVDEGCHTGYYSKYCVCIEADHQQLFSFDDAELLSVSGECFWFGNDVTHWVKNDSQNARISMICCIRTPRGHSMSNTERHGISD
jgi:hypothetical protein